MFKIAGILILVIYAGMFTCQAVAVIAQPKSDHTCGHEQEKTKAPSIASCCDIQGIAVKQFQPVKDETSHSLLEVAEIIFEPAYSAPEFAASPPLRFCKTAEHLAVLSILRI